VGQYAASKRWLKSKNPASAAVSREHEEAVSASLHGFLVVMPKGETEEVGDCSTQDAGFDGR